MERAVYRPLASRKLNGTAGYHRPSQCAARTDSPAVEVMTDLQQVPVATTTLDASLGQATHAMLSRCVRLLLVLDSKGHIAGLITARDTMGERPIKHLQLHGGKHDSLKVRDCMTAIHDIEVLTMKDVLRAEVGHIITTLKTMGRQHALVVDNDPITGDEMVRGIFSITQIGRQMGVSLQAFEVARTFAEIEAALAA